MKRKTPPQGPSPLISSIPPPEKNEERSKARDNLQTLETMRQETIQGGGPEQIEIQHRKGKLTARERLDLLLDEGSFEEFDLLKTGRGGAFGKESHYPGDGVVTGLDLVEMQLRIAAGEPLPLRQEDVSRKGWAMEARICAEDPLRDFLPDTGLITRYAVPRGKNIRVDSGIEAGSRISVYYDSLLAKVAVWGQHREQARETLVQALNGYHLEGLNTNSDFINAVLTHPAFISGDLSTNFVADHFQKGRRILPPEPEVLHYMAMASTLIYHNRNGLVRESLKPMATRVGLTPESQEWTEYMVKIEADLLPIRLFKKNPQPRMDHLGERHQISGQNPGF